MKTAGSRPGHGPVAVTIDHVGALGDGVAETPSGRFHIPFTAPGDEVVATPTGKGAAALTELIVAGPDRVTPPCRHFGRCGGCGLQHLSADFIAAWKRERVVISLARAGLGHVPVAETISAPAGSRRRATLAARRLRDRVILGFAERASHRLVDLAECPVLAPELALIIGPLRVALAPLLNVDETADLALTATDSGVDLLLIRKRPLSLADREAMAAMAETLDLARLSWRAGERGAAEPVAARRTPVVSIGARRVATPAGGFLQPSVIGQEALTGLVLRALGGLSGPFVDLFCGAGTFAIPVASLGHVAAFDGDAEAVAALAAARAPGVVAACRDLFREPLNATELKPFAAAILDPPRAGAEAQSRALVASAIPTIVYVSCNAVSFARDAAVLTAGGYNLERVTPVDQFPWSAHVELVGAFRR